jgi:hypothetical protein
MIHHQGVKNSAKVLGAGLWMLEYGVRIQETEASFLKDIFGSIMVEDEPVNSNQELSSKGPKSQKQSRLGQSFP